MNFNYNLLFQSIPAVEDKVLKDKDSKKSDFGGKSDNNNSQDSIEKQKTILEQEKAKQERSVLREKDKERQKGKKRGIDVDVVTRFTTSSSKPKKAKEEEVEKEVVEKDDDDKHGGRFKHDSSTISCYCYLCYVKTILLLMYITDCNFHLIRMHRT